LTEPNRESVYRRASHAAWRDLGDQLVVLDLTAKEIYGLNPTGGYLWRAFDGKIALDGLIDHVTSRESSIDRTAIVDFCDELVGLGLLEASQATSETEFVPGPTPDDLEPPVVVWHEPMRQAAASCAYLPAQNPLCNQAPFS